ncbi:MAG: CoA pyrophosphatase [Balneolales bacterium]
MLTTENMHRFLTFLARRVKDPLPGIEAQKIMAPVPDRDRHPQVSIPIDAAQSAVLLLFSFDSDRNLEILYTLRSQKLISHKGQISFPGGRTEKDETPVETALRETHEEVGIDPDSVEVLGLLSPLYVPPSNSVINPVVGYMDTLPELRLQESEVSEAFTITLDELLSKAKRQNEIWVLRGQNYSVPYWNVHSTPLWGATAMITSEVVELYREYISIKSL